MRRSNPIFLTLPLLALGIFGSVRGAELKVPAEYQTIQSAIDKALPGDIVVVSPGNYRERLELRPGVTVKSAGGNEGGAIGLARAEATIIDGSIERNEDAQRPGVLMAEGACLDGFTVTGVGVYDQDRWTKHHATCGNDQKHEHIGARGVPGISIDGVECCVKNNIVHHIGYTGIGIWGPEDDQVCNPVILANICYRNMGGGIGSMNKSMAIIKENVCFENFYAGIGHDDSSPFVVGNTCYKNIRAGIGISNGACPIVRGNKCFQNRRSGIGSRSLDSTQPMITDNECYENNMAGIGAEEHARPILKNNRCYRNKLAGIGCREFAYITAIENECFENGTVGIGHDHAAGSSLIGNHCHDNKMAGIGFEKAESAEATLIDNRVINNRLVAMGVHSGWKISATNNHFARVGGMPPIIMIFKESEVTLVGNRIEGSGIAGVRVEGELSAVRNKFILAAATRKGPKSQAVWELPNSDVSLADNTFEGFSE